MDQDIQSSPDCRPDPRDRLHILRVSSPVHLEGLSWSLLSRTQDRTGFLVMLVVMEGDRRVMMARGVVRTAVGVFGQDDLL